MIYAGKLNHELTLEEKTTSRDAVGGVVETWNSAGMFWAERVQRGGREFQAAGVTNAEITTIWRTYFFEEITTKHRLIHGSQVHEIVDVGEDPNEPPRSATLIYTKARAA